MKLSKQDALSVWRSAYAAAFVAHFSSLNNTASFDKALQYTSAERAAVVADRAVEELRALK
jgi:hypothetical protein